jgi:hypothetical protein
MQVKFEMTGFDKLIAKLRTLKNGKAIWKKAVRAGSAKLLKIARGQTPRESKALAKSLGLRIKASRKTGVVYGLVGPRRKFFKMWRGKKRVPSNYAHLTERGRKAFRQGNRTVGAVRGKRWLSFAVRAGKAQVMAAMSQKINEELVKSNAV